MFVFRRVLWTLVHVLAFLSVCMESCVCVRVSQCFVDSCVCTHQCLRGLSCFHVRSSAFVRTLLVIKRPSHSLLRAMSRVFADF